MPLCLSCGKTKTKSHFYLKWFFCFVFVLVFVLFCLAGYAIIKAAYKGLKIRAKKQREEKKPRAKKFPSMTHTSLTEESGTQWAPKKDENTQWLPQCWIPIQRPQVSLTGLSPDTPAFLHPHISDTFSSRPHTLLFAKKKKFHKFPFNFRVITDMLFPKWGLY